MVLLGDAKCTRPLLQAKGKTAQTVMSIGSRDVVCQLPSKVIK